MKDKLLPNTHFPTIVGLTALSIAICAAGFSVYGIATLFAGAAFSVAVMAGTLEFGKLVATTYLYRYWNKIGLTLKSYLTISVVVLMIITSLGIFGFLSSAYQKSALEYGFTQGKILQTEAQKAFHDESINSAKTRIATLNQVRMSQEARLSEAQTNSFISRNPIQLAQLQAQTGEMIKQANDEIKEKNSVIESERQALQKIDQQVTELKIGSASKKDIQTLKYVADQIGWDLNRVAFWFMLAIIFVFDPLAIALILAYNVAIFRRETLDINTNIPMIPDPVISKEILLDSGPKKA